MPLLLAFLFTLRRYINVYAWQEQKGDVQRATHFRQHIAHKRLLIATHPHPDGH